MAVGDVEVGHGVECGAQGGDRRCVVDQPDGVAHAVGRHVGDGIVTARPARNEVIRRRRVGIRQQHRAGLGGQRLDLADAVVFLVGAGELMLADAVAVVVGDRSGGHEAGLDMLAHGHPVGVIARRRIADQDAVGDQPVEIFRGFGVNLRGVGVGIGRQVDLGLGDVQEAERLSGSLRAGFGAGQHVVGRGGNIAGAAGRRAQSAEGLDEGHGEGFLVQVVRVSGWEAGWKERWLSQCIK